MHSEDEVLHSLQCMRDSGLPSLLMVTHALGGGVERHLQELQGVLKDRAHVVVVRPHMHAQQVLLTMPLYAINNGELQAHGVLKLAFKWPQGSAQMYEWFALLGIARVHVHHVLGFPQTFWEMLDRLQLPFDLTLHDHSIFTGNPSLLDAQGRFDPRWLDEGLSALPVGDAQVAQILNKLALHAHRVIVPSQALACIVGQFLPHLEILVRSHPEREIGGQYPAVQPLQLAPQQTFKVLCLGMLGLEKGAYVLARCAELAAQQQLNVEFILLGACHVALPESVRCMGLYQDAELLELIAKIAPHLVWLPAQCPETWSYTLSAGLRAGLPVLASDLGALPERLAGRPFTRLLAHTASAQQWLAAIQELQVLTASRQSAEAFAWQQQHCAGFYTATSEAEATRDQDNAADTSYLLAGSAENGAIKVLPLGFIQAQRLAHKQGGRWRILLLKVFYIASRWPWLARLLQYVPYRWQRRIKRAVSRAPLDKRIVSR